MKLEVESNTTHPSSLTPKMPQSTKKRWRTLMLIFSVPFILIIISLCVLFKMFVISKDGHYWIKTLDGITQHAGVFEADSFETAEMISKIELNFQMTPDISVRFRHAYANKGIVLDDVVVSHPSANGSLEIYGWYYTKYTDTGEDVMPAFSREEFLERLLEEMRKQLPEGTEVRIGSHFLEILDEYDAAHNHPIRTQNERFDSKRSNLFGEK